MRAKPLVLLLTTALCLLLLGTTPPALTQTSQVKNKAADRTERDFNNRDKNKNGLLDEDELNDQLRKDLERWDLNRDGKLSFFEYGNRAYDQARQRTEKGLQKWGALKGGKGAAFKDWSVEEFERRDRDGNGFLSREEVQNQVRNVFDKLDTNRDGKLNSREYRAYLTERAGQNYLNQTKNLKDLEQWRSQVVLTSDAELNPKVEVIHAGNLPPGLPEWFAGLDANKDGQISLHEWNKADETIQEFLLMDRNDDGLLTPQEVLRYLDLEHNSPEELARELEARGIDKDLIDSYLSDKGATKKAKKRGRRPPS